MNARAHTRSRLLFALLISLLGISVQRSCYADSDPAQRWFYEAYCSKTPVYHGWTPEHLDGKWSLLLYAAPYTTNLQPPPKCGRIVIDGASNETKTWTLSYEGRDGETVTRHRDARVTSLETSSGRWVVNDFGIFARDQYSLKPVSQLLLLGYTRNPLGGPYDTVLYASCNSFQVPMGQPLNRIGEFGILVRRGEEERYSDDYFRGKYNYVLGLTELGSVDDMVRYSFEDCGV